ncbi:branched-chain amino acid ABC transporter permease [Verticiella sediminum]|uniref:Branched-chain amino acid ABC transporter permease n=1 Tax=Verticiella sediminum TaxID=1247510 RepID=A0A556ACF7_9BURK|nr:branched-chain amino acid ABC transporter permease [Verticiella sediminum]TSH90576.1 branched-chain amino acid ABC transporter permease [Verticiella sediminum]
MLTQALINGLLLGGLYGVAAVGFSIVWGVMGIVNLAHGSFIMLGAYVAYFAFSELGIDPFMAIPAAMLLLFMMGYALQVVCLNRVMRTNPMLSLSLTFGLDLVLINVAMLLFTTDFRLVNTAYSGQALRFMDATVPYDRLATFSIAVLLAGLFFWFLRHTRPGYAILATALDRQTVPLMGINPSRVYALTAGLGAALAGGAGCLASMVFPISPTMGISFLGSAFVVTILGGVGSVEGAVIGGLLYGLVQSFASYFLGVSYQEVVAFSVFLAILVLRPQGLLGRQFYG